MAWQCCCAPHTHNMTINTNFAGQGHRQAVTGDCRGGVRQHTKTCISIAPRLQQKEQKMHAF
eukprot:1138730-Pelagomonas_calceolata.AAC.3